MLKNMFSRYSFPILWLAFFSPMVGISGPTVSARYTAGSTQSLSSGNNTLAFGTYDYDTANAVTGAGGSWTFTAPISGKYLISAMATVSGTWSAGDHLNLSASKSGSSYYLDKRVTVVGYTGLLVANGSTVLRLSLNDTIQIVANVSNSGSTNTNGDVAGNYVNVSRLAD